MEEATNAEVKEYWESKSCQPYGAPPAEEAANPQRNPADFWPDITYGSRPRRVACNNEELITVYGALRTYLKVLTQQPEEDLETIARVARLMITIKPQAVEASQEIASRVTSS